MKTFEFVSENHSFQESVAVHPAREALWCAAFGVETLDGLFDVVRVEEAIPRFDAAIRKFNEDPESLRPLMAVDDPVGMRGNRGILLKIRKRMAQLGGTVTGAIDTGAVSAAIDEAVAPVESGDQADPDGS